MDPAIRKLQAGGSRAPIYRRVAVSDPEAICVAGQDDTWGGLDVRQQVGTGRFRAEVEMARLPFVEVSTVTWLPGIVLRGAIRRGYTALVLNLAVRGGAYHQAAEVTPRELTSVTDREEMDYRWLGPAEMIDVNVQNDVLDRHCAALHGRPYGALVADGRARLVEGAAATWRRTIEAVLGTIAAAPSLLHHPKAAARLEAETLASLLSGLAGPAGMPAAASRRRVARLAEAFIREQMTEDVTIQDLCRLTGASERTLHLAFLECFGQPPKQYLKTARLNGARADLRRASPGVTVTDVAMKWGFLHLGRFSGAYRAMFHEAPVETLRRADRADAA